VSVNPANVAAGTYQGTITITAPYAVPSTATVAVTLTVQSGTPAALGVDTQNVSFTAIQGSGALTQQFHVLNTGGRFALLHRQRRTTSGGFWLSVSPGLGQRLPPPPLR